MRRRWWRRDGDERGRNGSPATRAPAVPPEARSSGTSRASTPAHRAPHPDRSLPRADWARLGPIDTASSAPAPTTFDGDAFGRSVAGARSLTHRPAPPVAVDAPSGVMLDVAEVERVIPSSGSVTGEGSSGSVGSEPGTAAPPGAVHRVPTVVEPAGSPRQTLLRSDAEFAFPPVPSAAAPADDTTPIEPISWTRERGFVHPRRMRLVGRRGSFDEATGTGDRSDSDGEVGVDHDRTPTLRFVPVAGSGRARPPHDLVELVERATGQHVGDATIDRSPAATARARELGAAAFAEGTTVHLPAELGDLDDPAVRGAAAHELVHIAQQRALQGDLPPEGTDAGRRLEAQARTVQRTVSARSPITPTFLRDARHRVEAPQGVQRLDPDDWHGPVYTEEEMERFDPEASDYPFAWQRRENEPTGGPAEQRLEWAYRWERAEGNMLQTRRDERYHELRDDDRFRAATSEGEAGAEANEIRLRQTLDAEMPFQFGPPPGIEPYPRSDAATAPPSQPAGPGRASQALEQLLAGGIGRRSEAAVTSVAGLQARYDRRLERERELRTELLAIKAAEAEALAQQPDATPIDDDTLVSLSQDEVRSIREIVDYELPVPGDAPGLGDTPGSRRVLDPTPGPILPQLLQQRVQQPRRQRTMTHRTAASGPATAAAVTSSTGSASPSSTPPRPAAASSPGPTVEGESDDERTTEAEAAMAEIAGFAAAAMSAEAAGMPTSLRGLQERIGERHEREREFRHASLRAKLDAAQQSFDGVRVVTLTRDEVAAIRAAIDTALPMGPDPVYLDDDDDVSMTADGDFGGAVPDALVQAGRREIERAPVSDRAGGTPAPAPAATTETLTPPGTEPDTDAAPAATAAAATPAVGASQRDDEEHAAAIVESMSELDLDALTRRMWSCIRRELRSELLIDRERAGALADFR